MLSGSFSYTGIRENPCLIAMSIDGLQRVVRPRRRPCPDAASSPRGRACRRTRRSSGSAPSLPPRSTPSSWPTSAIERISSSVTNGPSLSPCPGGGRCEADERRARGTRASVRARRRAARARERRGPCAGCRRLGHRLDEDEVHEREDDRGERDAAGSRILLGDRSRRGSPTRSARTSQRGRSSSGSARDHPGSCSSTAAFRLSSSMSASASDAVHAAHRCLGHREQGAEGHQRDDRDDHPVHARLPAGRTPGGSSARGDASRARPAASRGRTPCRCRNPWTSSRSTSSRHLGRLRRLLARDVGTDHDVAEDVRLFVRDLIVHREREDVGRARLAQPLLLERGHRRAFDEQDGDLGSRVDALLGRRAAHERDEAVLIDGDVDLLVRDEDVDRQRVGAAAAILLDIVAVRRSSLPSADALPRRCRYASTMSWTILCRTTSEASR